MPVKSASGQRRKWRHSQIKSAFLSTTDIHRGKRDVSFVHAITGKHSMMLPPHGHSVRVARYRTQRASAPPTRRSRKNRTTLASKSR
jgi:hypothetical protein